MPVGMLVEDAACTASGCPAELTRIAPESHCPVTHGGVGVALSVHPAMAYGELIVTAGAPSSRTRGVA
ncbi:hypothetical protein [Mycolicibacterium insubricum]|uniref:hypothetical protein n=1 Tax=Mycolicibacterium insubricum TaxID=444597 RepID=UPI0021F32F60|nr:hypothetical protein [Mycolicibacterium insubricum]MCV7083830.1 hypothetical protein [Mycolicibacterium insubricum]